MQVPAHRLNRGDRVMGPGSDAGIISYVESKPDAGLLKIYFEDLPPTYCTPNAHWNLLDD